MKTVLVGLGVLSAAGGLVMFVVTLDAARHGIEGGYANYGIVAAAYLVGGFAGSIITWSIAEVIGRLERLETSYQES